MPKEKRKNSGFTLVEMLIFIFIFSVISVTFYSTWTLGTRYIIFVKNRFTALSLANEKMEVARNLAYGKIAHTGSTPPGNIHQDEYVMHSGKEFHVRTRIRNVDDPLDGTLGGSPNDTDFIDYKNVRVEVSWDNDAGSVVLASRFVPQGIESSAANMGVLVVNVFSDQSGSNISGSTVQVTNSDTGFSETNNTDSFGRLMLVGLLESNQKYKVTLVKNGYEAVETFPPYPNTGYNPTDMNTSVIKESVNTISIIQNKLAALSVKTSNYLGQTAGNIKFYLKGGRKMGMEYAPPNDPVYKLDSHTETGSDGEKDFGSVSPGQYEFVLEEPGYTIIGMDPISPITLPSEQSININVKVSPNNETALLVKIQKDATNMIPGASVHLTNSNGYDTTITTGNDGMAFFPDVETPAFAEGEYDLSITAVGYQDHSGKVNVSKNNLKVEEVIMLAS
jgi:type II secretory pathway pseudopilin PulG